MSEKNIEIYMNLMEKILNVDILKKILTIINLDIKNKKKIYKYFLNKKLSNFKQIYCIDKNYIVYRNCSNNLAIKQNSANKKKLSLIKTNKNILDFNSDIILNNYDNIILNSSNMNNIKIYIKYI